jgi:hypothetical protein
MEKNLIPRWTVLILLMSCCTPLKIAAQTGGVSQQTAIPSSATPAANADSDKLNARFAAMEQAAALPSGVMEGNAHQPVNQTVVAIA